VALSKKISLKIGEKERLLTRAAAGIEQLVDQFARGDRYARRDLFDLAEKLGLDLAESSKAALKELTGEELAEQDQALVAAFFKRNSRSCDSDAQTSTDEMQENSKERKQP
jgi:hypothetical protein